MRSRRGLRRGFRRERLVRPSLQRHQRHGAAVSGIGRQLHAQNVKTSTVGANINVFEAKMAVAPRRARQSRQRDPTVTRCSGLKTRLRLRVTERIATGTRDPNDSRSPRGGTPWDENRHVERWPCLSFADLRAKARRPSARGTNPARGLAPIAHGDCRDRTRAHGRFAWRRAGQMPRASNHCGDVESRRHPKVVPRIFGRHDDRPGGRLDISVSQVPPHARRPCCRRQGKHRPRT